MADRIGRDASLGPLRTPEPSANKRGSEEGFFRSPTIEVESPGSGNKVPSTAPAGERNAKRDESLVTPTPVKPPPGLDSLEENPVMFKWKTPLQVACAWGPRLDSLEENPVMFEWKTPLQVACAWGLEKIGARLDSLEENPGMFEWKTPLQVACAWFKTLASVTTQT